MVNYPIISKKYIDGLSLETDTHRHFRTSKQISEPARVFLQIYIIFICAIFVVYDHDDDVDNVDNPDKVDNADKADNVDNVDNDYKVLNRTLGPSSYCHNSTLRFRHPQ